MLKQKIREQIKKRKSLSSKDERERQSRNALRHLEEHTRFRQAKTVLLYYALPDEIDTTEFLRKWSTTKQICLPVVDGENLRIKRYQSEQQLREGAFHILEPSDTYEVPLSDIELAVIPGVAFDRNGNRLGRGKGFYDRLFSSSDNQKNIYKIGICFDFQMIEQLPVMPHDIRMDEVITG